MNPLLVLVISSFSLFAFLQLGIAMLYCVEIYLFFCELVAYT